MPVDDSRISGFYALDAKERRKIISERTGISADDMTPWSNPDSMDVDTADRMIENVVGRYSTSRHRHEFPRQRDANDRFFLC